MKNAACQLHKYIRCDLRSKPDADLRCEPDVPFCADPDVGGGAGEHERTFPAEAIVVALEHGASHPEVGQLDGPAGVDEAVAAGDVSVQRQVRSHRA